MPDQNLSIEHQATEWLKGLLKLDTTNSRSMQSPGNESLAVDFIKAVLDKEGIDSTIVEKTPGRANLVARLKGDGSKQPLLLSGHTDVVPADTAHWTQPPFGAVEHNGFLYGRGTIDMKNMVAMSLAAIVQAKRLKDAGKLSPKRDIIFAAIADEEAGCANGSQFLVKKHPDLIRAEYLLTEIGGFTLHMDGLRFYPLQVAEKGVVWLRITFTGEPGHSSIPLSDSAVIKASTALAKLGKGHLPLHVTKTMGMFLGHMSEHLPGVKGKVMGLLKTPTVSEFLCKTVIPDAGVARTMLANLHNTAVPVKIAGGEESNVIPASVTVDIDGRILPGFTAQDLVKEIRQVIGSEPSIEILRESLGSEHDIVGTDLWQTVTKHITANDPGSIPIPFQIPGFTDASYYHRLGMKCLGFAPVKLPEGLKFAELFHGHDERIPLEGFHWGTKVLCETVLDFVRL